MSIELILACALVGIVAWALLVVTWMLRNREVSSQRMLDVAVGLVDKQALIMAASVDRARRDKSPVIKAVGDGSVNGNARKIRIKRQKLFDESFETGQMTDDMLREMTEDNNG